MKLVVVVKLELVHGNTLQRNRDAIIENELGRSVLVRYNIDIIDGFMPVQIDQKILVANAAVGIKIGDRVMSGSTVEVKVVISSAAR